MDLALCMALLERGDFFFEGVGGCYLLVLLFAH